MTEKSGPVGGPDDAAKKSRHKLILSIADNAMIACLYFLLTVLFEPLSFGPVQCRFAEALILLSFWRPDFAIGLTVGCLLANIFSWSSWDLLFGTLATLLSCLFVAHFSRRLLFSLMWPIAFNGLIIGAELTLLSISPLPFWVNALSVAGGEAIAVGIGYLLWFALRNNKSFWKGLRPIIHSDWRW
jgi:uncharacterized membrane protein